MSDSTPPPTPSEALSPPKTTWPKTLGIVGIIFGVVGFLGAIGGPLMTKASKMTMQAQIDILGDKGSNSEGADILSPMLDTYDKVGAMQMKLMAPAAIAAALLIFGCVCLIRRQPKARPLIIVWSILKIGVVFLTAILMSGMNGELMAAGMGGAGEELPEAMASVGKIMGSVMTVFSVAWGCALPIFMLVWFLRKKIVNQVKAWA